MRKEGQSARDYPAGELWDAQMMAFGEFHYTGFTQTDLFHRYGNLSDAGLLTSATIHTGTVGQEYCFLGIIRDVQEKVSQKGYRWGFATFSDSFGNVDVRLNGSVIDRCKKYISDTSVLLLYGKVGTRHHVAMTEDDEDDHVSMNIQLSNVRPPIFFLRDNATKLVLTPPKLGAAHIHQIQACLALHEGPRPVDLVMDMLPQARWTYRLPQRVDITDALFSDLEKIFLGAPCAMASYGDL